MVDPDVGASYTGTTTREYTFHSWTDKNPVNGVPGLVGYCVYTNQTPTSVTVAATAVGDNNQLWKASKASQTFSFVRPGGEKSNIGLDGDDTVMGTAEFGTSPSQQTILLHVSDAATCQTLYPGSTSTTCFVLPGPRPGPVCDAAAAGDASAAYNNIPKDVLDCNPPSQAFQAQSTSEFGDEVQLNTAAGHITSLTVEFQSWGCSESGHWEQGATNPCVTTPGETFTHPITANIYDESSGGLPGLLLANGTVTTTQTIPYRPSADPACTGANVGKWFNTASQTCVNSKGVLLTFTFPNGGPAVTADQKVVWTVAFNTSSYGSPPIGPAACSEVVPTDPGCGYDSLNVGSKTFTGAPYAGSFVDASGAFMNSSNGIFYCDGGTAGTGFLRADTPCWNGFQPLGKIVVNPT